MFLPLCSIFLCFVCTEGDTEASDNTMGQDINGDQRVSLPTLIVDRQLTFCLEKYEKVNGRIQDEDIQDQLKKVRLMMIQLKERRDDDFDIDQHFTKVNVLRWMYKNVCTEFL